jgi:predicted nucleic acid-binding protein
VQEARSDVRALFHWLTPVDPEVILAAAQSMGCGFVLSEDLPTGQELEGIRVVNPFAMRPSEIGG